MISRLSLITCCAVVMVISFVIAIFSGTIDLYLSDLVYNGDFYWQDNIFVKCIDKFTRIAVGLLFIGCIVLWIYGKSKSLNIIDNLKIKYLSICFFVWCTALPIFLKYLVGRARPLQTDIYFGNCNFTNAFELATCAGGDSFISGHTSFAMFLFAFALCLNQKIRFKSIIAICLLIVAVAISRIMGGYHYFTDVYFAIVLVGSGILFTYYKCFNSLPKQYFSNQINAEGKKYVHGEA